MPKSTFVMILPKFAIEQQSKFEGLSMAKCCRPLPTVLEQRRKISYPAAVGHQSLKKGIEKRGKLKLWLDLDLWFE